MHGSGQLIDINADNFNANVDFKYELPSPISYVTTRYLGQVNLIQM